MIDSQSSLSSFDRLFPNQDELTQETSLGNLIALPFQAQAVEQGNTIFLDPATDFVKPYKDQLEILQTISYLSAADLDRFIQEHGLENPRMKAVVPSITAEAGPIEKLLDCDFIRWCRDHPAQVSEPLWIAMLSNVARVSPGGLDLCHQFSRGYPGYSYAETEAKIRHLLNDSKPHTCKYIRDNGFTCGKNCGIKAPINLIFRRIDQVNLPYGEEARHALEKIMEITNGGTPQAIAEVLDNPEYIGCLALVAATDSAQFEATLTKMQNNGFKTKDINSLRRAISSKRREIRGLRVAEPGEKPALVKIKEIMPEAPVNDQMLIPAGWSLSLYSGLEKVSWGKDLSGSNQQIKTAVSSAPVILVGRRRDVNNGTEAVRLAWYRDGQWQFQIVDRKLMATARNITELADYGVPVTNLTANALVEFLYEFESLNLAHLPLAQCSRHLGWQGKNQGFLWGKTHLTPDGLTHSGIDLHDLPPENWQKDFIAFRASDAGDEQIANAFKARGAYENWIAAINDLFFYPWALAGVYFSLIPPFLEILQVENFTVDWSNVTSTGKTTVLRIAASCWGNPDESSAASVIYTWDATKVWIEKAAAMLNGLPLILDDTKLAGTGKSKDYAAAKISQVLYQIASGRGRGRGSVVGLRGTGAWRTIMLSTGEQPAIDFTTGDGGSRARVITLWGLPFGKADNTTAALVKEINSAVKQHYGHAGPRVIQFILANQEKWPQWRAENCRLRAYFSNRAGTNPVALRICDYFATLATIIPIVHAALPELRRDLAPEQIIDPLWKAAIAVAEEADRATAALQEAYTWAVANQTSFWGRHQMINDLPRIPSGGWAGAWKPLDWSYIAFTSKTLRQILKEGGFDGEAVLKTWKDREWLETNSARRVVQVRIDGGQDYCYGVKRSTIEKILNITEEPKDRCMTTYL